MMKRIFEAAARQDIYTRVTDMVIADLEKGVRPWTKPWSAGNTDGRIMRPLRHNGQPYAGINVLMLWAAAMENGYDQPRWLTYRQASELGGHVRKGEKASPVVYTSTFKKNEHTDQGDIEKELRFLKTYSVFNVAQIEGLPEQFYDKPPPVANPVQRIAHAEEFFANTGADIRTGGDKAFYSPGHDYIRMPPIESFTDPVAYYSTLAHETIHWTKATNRLERDFGRKRFGDEGYATEELVAELGATFLCADLDLEPAPREDHASYIDHWLKVLKSDKRFIFTAASHAQKAATFLHGLQPAIHTPELAPDAEAEPGYTLEVRFNVPPNADEHIQSPDAIRSEAQSWLESLDADVRTVSVREQPQPRHVREQWQEDDELIGEAHEPPLTGLPGPAKNML